MRSADGDGGVVDAERPGDGDGRERVGDVEAPAQRGAQVQPRAPAVDDGEVRALEARAHVDGAHVGVALDGHGRDVHLGGQARAPGVVDVDDPHTRAGLEEPALGEEVLLHRRVEVEMVLAEVREHRDGPVDRVRAVQLQRVAGDLHRAGGVAAVGHLGERGLEVDGLRRRAREGPLAARDDALHGPQQRGAAAGALQQLADEERGGRLAARPGDADDVQPGAGIAVEPRGDGRHRGADVVDLHLGHAEPERVVDDQRHGAVGDRLGREVVPVTREAAHAEEQRAGLHAASVVREARDLGVALGVREELAQPHRRDRTGSA